MKNVDPGLVRISTGLYNTVNDLVIGGVAGITGASKFAGQLGQGWYADDDQIFYSSTVGAVYGGHFRYVRLAAAATVPVVRGQIVFWDISVADNLYQVTTAESGSTDGAMFRAGIVLNPSWSAGYYSVIQDLGICAVKFRGTLTTAGAAGSRCFCAAAGAGVDLGLGDVIDSANPTLFSDVSLMLGRFLGVAKEAPTNGGTKLVDLGAFNVRG